MTQKYSTPGLLDFLKEVKFNDATRTIYDFHQISPEQVVVIVYSSEGEVNAVTDVNFFED